MNHPNAIELEAFACGDAAPRVASHVESCDACRAYVERVQGVTREAPPALLGPVVARARKVERLRIATTAATFVVPLAIAAAILLFLRAPKPVPPQAEAPRPTATETVAMAQPEPDTTFKGGIQLAVVRERGVDQARYTGVVKVRPGDRLRLEVALDRSQAILGAVFGDDGSYLELMPDAVRDAGTHFSERSARIDAQPTRGTLAVGSPEAIARARVTGKLDGLATVRVEWEGP